MPISPRIESCIEPEHSTQILDIFNEAIVNSTALYEYHPRTPEFMREWFAEKRSKNFPVLGAFDECDVLMGFASYGRFRPQPAFKYTVEHSIYLHPAHRGKGIGRILLDALIEHAHAQQIHCMVGVIDASNTASIMLHEQLGFTYAGMLQQAGFKFGEWLNVAFYQLLLNTPNTPVGE